MKYYAVTDDPRELYHYGVKGMKWGQHIFGPEPGLKKSPAYRKAQQKLKSISAKASTGARAAGASLKKSAAQRNYNRQMKQQDKYAKAVQKAQRRTAAIEDLHRFDQQYSYRKQLTREQKAARINEKLANVNADRDLKNLRKSIKSEKKLDKYMQQAREGTLRYGKLSEDQIHKVQERLNLENQARQLGGREKQSWRAQKKEARRQGKLLGIQKGTAAIMEEVARGAAQFGIQGFKNRMMMKSAAKNEGRYEKAKQKVKNKKSAGDMRKEVRDKVKQEVYENEVREGGGVLDRAAVMLSSTSGRAALLKTQNSIKEQKRIEDERKKLNDDLYRKLVLGDKQHAPIVDPEERRNIYNQIYGISGSKSSQNGAPNTPIKAPSKITNSAKSLYGNLKDTAQDYTDSIHAYAGIRQRVEPKDIYNGKKLNDTDIKAIIRNNKKWLREQKTANKWARAQRDSVSRMNKY